MKKTIMLLFTAIILSLSGNAQSTDESKTFESRKEKVVEILKKNVSNGLPGVSIAFSGPAGDWVYSEGYANVEKKQILKFSNLHYLQSVSKLFMAVEILQLYEEGKISLDDNICKYLKEKNIGSLYSKDITIKMLLNHTSGIPEYATNPKFVSFVMEHATKPFKVQQCIDIVKGLPLDFEPGTNYSYSNTNYTLLSMIADKITGNHTAYMEKNIFRRAGLGQTVYLTKDNYESVPKIVNSYWDVLNIEKPADITLLQKVNVASLKGDDGIVCTTQDAVKFMKALVRGQLLKPETMKLMQEWVIKDNQKRYGLGLTYYDLGSTYAVGHSGGGIGAGCVLMYLPELDTYVFMATNFTTLIESKISQQCSGIQNEILSALFL